MLNFHSLFFIREGVIKTTSEMITPVNIKKEYFTTTLCDSVIHISNSIKVIMTLLDFIIKKISNPFYFLFSQRLFSFFTVHPFIILLILLWYRKLKLESFLQVIHYINNSMYINRRHNHHNKCDLKYTFRPFHYLSCNKFCHTRVYCKLPLVCDVCDEVHSFSQCDLSLGEHYTAN